MIIANIEDLRRLARRRLPRVLFDYIDGGAQDEVTLRANQKDFNRITLAQHVSSPKQFMEEYTPKLFRGIRA